MRMVACKPIRAFAFLVLFFLVGLAPATAQNGYGYHRAITIDHTKVPNTDQSNFPVLFSGTYSYLKTTANGGNVTSANGYDIVFTSDAAGTTALTFERESYNATTGAVSFWVKIPTVSHTSDTVFYVFYGNSSVTTDQSNKTGVWDTNYAGVWHEGDNAANTTVSDSTSNGRTGTNAANTSTKTTTGEISGALTYNGTSDLTRVSYNAGLNPSQLTVEGWAYITGGAGTYRAVVSSRDSSGTNRKGYIIYAQSNDTWAFWTGNGSAFDQVSSGTAVSLNTWTHVVATYNGTNATIYINGVQKATAARTYVVNTTYETRFGAGANESSPPQFYLPGNIDEVRISNSARSADWIATEYNNQTSPSVFYSVGVADPYTYSRAITLDHTKVPNTDQSNFPVLVSGTYSYLATTANAGNVTNASGYDIVFTSDPSGATPLAFERESYNATTGAVNFWVKIPTVSHTSDTVFYMFYGNSAITTDQSNKTGVWDSNYKGVWHLPNGTTLSGSDSTSSANNGTLINSPTATAGQVSGGMQVNGQTSGTSYLDLGNSSSIQSGGNITVSAWVNTSAFNSTGFSGILGKETWSSSGFSLADNGPYGSSVYFRVLPSSTGSCGAGMACIPRSAVNTGTWHYLVGAYDGSTVKLYLDGVLYDSRTATSFTGDTASSMKVGNFSGNAGSGKLDEPRFSTTARSADWIASEYNNQNSPSTFYTVGGANFYTYHRTITLDHTKVPNTDQSNFPMLVSGTYSYLATTANGGSVTNANGYDIIFTSDAAGTSPLAYERESYNATTGAVNFWVKVPTASHSSDTVIYMFYGNSSVTADQSNKTGVWDSNYKGVWHLPNGTTLSGSDSTSTANNGTLINSPTATTGEVGGGMQVNGQTSGTSYLDLGNSSSLQSGGNITVSAWVNTSSFNSTGTSGVAGKEAWPSSGFSLGDSGQFGSYILFRVLPSSTGSCGTGQACFARSLVNNGVWHYIVGVYDGSTVKLYLDGALQDSRTATSFTANTTTNLAVGNFGGSAGSGKLDEPRFSTTARSADWIAAEYNNQSSPSAFYSLGSTGAPSITSLSPASGDSGTSVTITGGSFGSTGTVTFNGTTATPTTWNSSTIVVPVPSGATTGKVVVTVGGTASNGVTFTVPSPTITSLQLTSGSVGASFTIYGTNFGSSRGSSTVTFNGTAVTSYGAWVTGSIGVTVPSGATTGNVVVTVAGAASNGVSFTVTAPTIISLSSSSGVPGASININGSSLGSSGTIMFHGAANPATFSTWNSATIAGVIVPADATTGNVVVTVSGVASNGVNFTVQCPSTGAGVFYYLSDALGSSRIVTDSSGVICDDSDFYPYGGERPITSALPNHYKFTGKERDSESGLDDFWARYYTSQYGRFMTPDPDNAGAQISDPQSWNGYAYVRNNPISLSDPNGLDYKVCVNAGDSDHPDKENCFTVFTQKDVNNLVNSSAGASSQGDKNSGQIFATVDGQQVQVGTYQHVVGLGDEHGGLQPDYLGDTLIGMFAGGVVNAGRGLVEGLAEITTRETVTGASTGAASGASAYPSEIAGYRLDPHFFDSMKDLGHRIPSEIVEQVAKYGQDLPSKDPNVLVKYLPGVHDKGVTVVINIARNAIFSAHLGRP